MVNGELALKASDWINQQRCLHYKAMAQRESNDLSSNMLSREEIFKIMRVKPVRQMINGVDYFYSLLAKKNKKFILTNMRFLLIKGIESISYARDPGKDIKVPFLSVYELPNPKDTIDLQKVRSCTNDDAKLKIRFASDGQQTMWQFVCVSKASAIQWVRRIEMSLNNLKDFKEGKHEKYEDYLLAKADLAKQIKITQELEKIKVAEENKVIAQNQELKDGQIKFSLTQVLEDKKGIQAKPLDKLAQVSSSQAIPKPKAALFQGSEQITALTLLQVMADHGPQQKSRPIIVEDRNSLAESSLEENKQYLPTALQLKPSQNYQPIARTIVKEETAQGKKSSSLFSRLNSSKSNSPSLRLTSSQNWTDQFVKSIDDSTLLANFRMHTQNLVCTIIDQLALSPSQQSYEVHESSADTIAYLVNDCWVELYLLSETQLATKQKSAGYIRSKNSFKSYEYLLSVTENRTNLKIPLMAIVHYKGIAAMVVSKTEMQLKSIKMRDGMEKLNRQSMASSLNQQFVSSCLSLDFEENSHITNKVFSDLTKIILTVYEKPSQSNSISLRSRQSKSPLEKLYLVSAIRNFLPVDTAWSRRTLATRDHLIRSEYLHQEDLEDFVFDQGTNDLKILQICQAIPLKCQQLIRLLEQQEYYFTNSVQLTELMHSCGINMRYLGYLYDNTQQKWLKELLRSELVARCAKQSLSEDLQEYSFVSRESFNSTQSNPIGSHERLQAKRVISFLNVLFGHSSSTDRLWEKMDSYCEIHFKCFLLSRKVDQLNLRYLLLAISHHCRFTISFTEKDVQSIAFKQKGMLLQVSDFVGFHAHVSTYQTSYLGEEREIEQVLEEESMEGYRKLRRLLGISESETSALQLEAQLEQLYKKSNPMLFERTVLYLLNFIPPSECPSLYQSATSLKDPPSRLLYETKMSELKWYMKDTLKDKIKQVSEEILIHLQTWLGKSPHPIYVDLYSLMAHYYHEVNPDDRCATFYSKYALTVLQHMLPSEHIKLSEQYYLLGRIHESYGRTREALQDYRKAKEILDFRIGEAELELVSYAELCISISKLSLQSKSTLQESFDTSLKLTKLLKDELAPELRPLFLKNLELLLVCCDLNPQYLSCYPLITQQVVSLFPFYTEDTSQLLQLTRLILRPQLRMLASQDQTELFHLLSQLELFKQSQGRQSLINTRREFDIDFTSLEYLRSRIFISLFPSNYLTSLQGLHHLLVEIDQNNMLERWTGLEAVSNQTMLNRIGNATINRGFDFLAVCTALVGTIGLVYFQEVLTDK